MAKRTTYPSDNWGTPEHEAWARKTYGAPRKADHPVGCECPPCAARWAETKRYLDYIRRVDR